MIAPEGAPGRFPAEAEARVAKRIQKELVSHNVGYGYGSLACGADTLIAEALLERNGEVEIVLPFEMNTFVKASVARGGPKWLERFNKCLKQVRVIHAAHGEYAGDADIAYASRLAMGLALLRTQQLCSRIVQLAVWDGQETGGKAGTWADIREWQSRGLKTVTVCSEGNLATNLRETRHQQSDYHLPPRKVRAIMFGDFHDFGRLTDRQMLTFFGHIMLRVAEVLDQYEGNIVTRNTWGDGIYVVLDDLGSAAHCALEIQSALAKLDFGSLGLPTTLGLRLGLDCGPVFEIQDPILKSVAFTGSHISLTARLEPSTPPGEVYVTEAFAALFTLIEHKELICEYVGMIKVPKGHARLRTYLLRRRAYTGIGQRYCGPTSIGT
jgi:class 3 adenylate cyclase